MPTYQYACKECGHAFDQVQSFSDDALTVCPVCQGQLRKVFNAVGVVFKGSGFYRNDSRDDGRKKTSESTTKSDSTSTTSASSDSTSGSKSDTKSDTKSTSGSKPESSSASTPAASSSGSSPKSPQPKAS